MLRKLGAEWAHVFRVRRDSRSSISSRVTQRAKCSARDQPGAVLKALSARGRNSKNHHKRNNRL